MYIEEANIVFYSPTINHLQCRIVDKSTKTVISSKGINKCFKDLFHINREPEQFSVILTSKSSLIGVFNFSMDEPKEVFIETEKTIDEETIKKVEYVQFAKKKGTLTIFLIAKIRNIYDNQTPNMIKFYKNEHHLRSFARQVYNNLVTHALNRVYRPHLDTPLTQKIVFNNLLSTQTKQQISQGSIKSLRRASSRVKSSKTLQKQKQKREKDKKKEKEKEKKNEKAKENMKNIIFRRHRLKKKHVRFNTQLYDITNKQQFKKILVEPKISSKDKLRKSQGEQNLRHINSLISNNLEYHDPTHTWKFSELESGVKSDAFLQPPTKYRSENANLRTGNIMHCLRKKAHLKTKTEYA